LMCVCNVSKDIPQRRVKRWSFNVRELLKDAAGREHFRRFLEKEFSAENLKSVTQLTIYLFIIWIIHIIHKKKRNVKAIKTLYIMLQIQIT